MSRRQAAERRGRRNETGDKLVSSLRVKVFSIGNHRATIRILKPKPGTGWTAAGVDEILDSIGADLEQRFPNEEFHLVEIGANAFNFVHGGPRAAEIGEADGAPGVGVRSVDPSPG